MSSTRSVNPWRLGNMLLWMVFFLLGLQPDKTFYLLRSAGQVVTQRAYVNSPYLITYSLAGFLAFVAYRACREARLGAAESRGKATQLALLALIAFFPFPFEQALDYRQIAVPLDRYLNVAFGVGKCWAWLYLLSVMLRYEILDGPRVFRRMSSAFPSARPGGREPRDDSACVPETSPPKSGVEPPPQHFEEGVLREKDPA